MNTIRAVLIDLDDTLYSYKSAHLIAISSCHHHFNQRFWIMDDFKEYYREKRDQVTLLLSGQGACRSRLFAFQYMFEEKGLPTPYSVALEFEELYWQVLIDAAEPFPEAIEFLATCKAADKPVCIVSDMQASIQIRKIKKMQLEQYIDYMVTSEEAGCEKPAPDIFQMALNKLGLMPHQVVMLGDNCIKDVKGAEDLGIHAFLITENECSL